MRLVDREDDERDLDVPGHVKEPGHRHTPDPVVERLEGQPSPVWKKAQTKLALARELGPIDIQRSQIMLAARWMKARKWVARRS